MSAYALRARAADGYTHVTLELRDPLGRLLEWVEIPSVRHGDAREAQLAARVIQSATRGAVTRGAALRVIRAKDAA